MILTYESARARPVGFFSATDYSQLRKFLLDSFLLSSQTAKVFLLNLGLHRTIRDLSHYVPFGGGVIPLMGDKAGFAIVAGGGVGVVDCCGIFHYCSW